MGEATRDDVPGGLLEKPPLIDESHGHFFERLSKVGAILVKGSGCTLFETLHPHEERGAPAHAPHDGRAYLRKVEEGLPIWHR